MDVEIQRRDAELALSEVLTGSVVAGETLPEACRTTQSNEPPAAPDLLLRPPLHLAKLLDLAVSRALGLKEEGHWRP